MKKLMLGLIAAFAAQCCVAAVPKKQYGQCTELYPKGAFIGDEKGVVDLADAAKNGPCANGDKTFVPAIDRKTGVTTMKETTADKVEAAIKAFRSDLYVFRNHHVSGKDALKSVRQATADARAWMGWAEAKPKPAGYEVLGSPVGGPVVGRFGEPIPPQARLHPARQTRYVRDQYGRLVPIDPLREEGPYAIVGVPSRGVGQLGYGVRRAGQDITSAAGYNLEHLPNNPAALVVAPVSIVAGFFGLGVQAVGGITEIPAHILGHAVPDTFRARQTRAEQQRRWMERQSSTY